MDKADKISERSLERIDRADLTRFARIAEVDRADFFRRYPLRRNAFRCAALCQGGALHYLDGTNGLKDIDLWSFYAKEDGIRDFPYRRMLHLDMGRSKFGVHPDDARQGYEGRRVDLLGRSINFSDVPDVVSALQRYLSQKKTATASALSKKAVILIDPPQYRGRVVWPR